VARRADAALLVGLAAGLCLLGFVTTGGFDQSITVSSSNTWAEIVLTLLGGAALIAMLVLAGPGPRWGGGALALFALLTAYTALSISWSVQPDDSWQAANLTLAFLAVFAGGLALARLAPERWPVVVSGVAVACVVISGYALLADVFPGSLAAADTPGRLQEPLGYWNATGAMAALGLAPALWAFTRREGGPLLRGLAVPAGTVLASVVVLSYSRTALVVAVLALAAWFVFCPGRLRAALMVGLSGLGTAVICAWALTQPGLSNKGAALAARTSAGHMFGAVLLVVLTVSLAVGVAGAVASERVTLPAATRRRIGAGLLGLAAMLPVLAILALAFSSRGLFGQISHAWNSLTSTGSTVSNGASRLTQLGSSRPLYWSQGIAVGEHALLKGVGALGYVTARTRYTTNNHIAGHAHSYVIQTFADLGLVGLALNLALLVAWVRSAVRPLLPGTRWSELASEARRERAGMVALAILVVAYGILSATDWTYYFPAVTVPALLAAGWLCGRGPLLAPVGRGTTRVSLLDRPLAGLLIALVTLVALGGAWVIWQPLRAANDATAALTASTTGQAFSDARAAKAEDPLALQPRFVLSALDADVGDLSAARNELVGAVNLQPENHDSWLQLALFDLQHHHPRLALSEFERSFELDPTVAATTEGITQARTELR
jgi:hypothetical protein